VIRDSLKASIPNFEYQEIEKCGHSPWVEVHARESFFAQLRSWLERHLSS
jgi:pimeloyl-ACP methyl ester carboxylesterase